MTTISLERNCEFTLNNDDFDFICRFVYEHTGIVLNEGKREMIYRRFTRIIRERKLNSFTQYCDLLRKQPEQESNYFFNAITTNLTSFFREQHHFDYLLATELPRLAIANANSKRIRVWSCASSTGEEPYSLAIAIREQLQALIGQWDIKILATDIDTNVLNKAKKGVYAINKIEEITEQYKHQYFHRGIGKNLHSVRVDSSLQNLITFKQLNLLDGWPMTGKFDIVFCRNVLIYFDKPTQQELFARFLDILEPGGILVLGHSESLGTFEQYFENVGRTIYRKK
ncbi:CheR family methyltransferase [Thalassotalea sp. PLHSN55]|uniref:CheR family methyltransferase n=1 Tax=Thalassotalea sp. PLHSN55 TaxID=3435888 RepID=UPI003F83BAAC